MFLYDKSKRLLAADVQSVKELGFESLEQFFDQISDLGFLFEERPGYVYRFKNFSWIDFILFNPTKEHRVILRPTGTETTISVTELTGKDGETFYAVTFGAGQSGILGAPLFGMQEVVQEEPQEEPVALFESSEASPAPKEQQERYEDPLFGIELETQEPQRESLETIELFTQESPAQEERPLELIEPKEQEPLELFSTQDEVKEVDTSQQPTSDESKTYDIDAVARELEIDTQMLTDLLQEYVEQVIELRPLIYNALAARDLKEAKEQIHKIKGATSNLRIRSLDEVLSATQGVEDFEQLRQIMDRFYERFVPFAQQLSAHGIVVDLSELDRPIQQPQQTSEPETEPQIELKIEPEISQEAPQEQAAQPKQQSVEAPLSKASLLARASSELGLEQEAIEELVVDYLVRALNLLPILEQKIHASKSEELRSVVHQLKGSALNLRLDILAKLLESIATGDFEAYKEFREIVLRLAKEFGVEPDLRFSSEMIQERAQEIGVDEESYRELLKEFFDELESSIAQELSVQQIKALRSAANNLRLSFVAGYLESILEDSQNRDYYVGKIKEIIETFKGEL